MPSIPWASPGARYRKNRELIQAAVTRVLEGGDYILGREVQLFEQAFAAYCGVDHAVGVGSGTDALILALRAIGVGAGDEVITVSHTAVATVAAVLATSATPVLVDVDPASYTMESTRIDKAITSRSKAIVVVHLYGQSADMNAISEIGRRHGLRIVEDCAQAVGARYRGRMVGGLGDIACFSFYPTKNLGAIGDGGIVVTRSSELSSRVRRLRQYGWDESRNTHEVGVNSRLDTLQASILRATLPHLDAENVRRAAIARRYNEGLAGLPLTSPAARLEDSHVYHLYVVRCDERDRLQKHLEADQIGSAVHYPVPVHWQPGYAERIVVAEGGLSVTESLSGQILSLPIYPELSDSEVDRVVASVRRYFGCRPVTRIFSRQIVQ